MSQEPGRRERKKAATRQALADAALELFMAHGYDNVTVNQIADAADVSVTTLFKHYPNGKQALVFDQDPQKEAELVAAVTGRAPGQSILDALHGYLSSMEPVDPEPHVGLRKFLELVNSNPALRDYSDRMWQRYAESLAVTIAAEAGLPEGDISARALARFAVDAVTLVETQEDPHAALDTVFQLLKHGWGQLGTK